MGWTCNTHGRDEKHKILIGKTEGKDHSKVLGVDGKVILE
jgi:hypothetical protein